MRYHCHRCSILCFVPPYVLEHLAEACVGFPDPLREPAPPAPAVAVMAR